MAGVSRFDCASSSLALKDLLAGTKRVAWVCLGLGAAVHASLAAVRGLEAEQQTAKPLTTQFVKRQPRLTKPLELKKRPQPRRRTVQRQMVAVTASRHAADQSVAFQPAGAIGGLARPGVQVGRIPRFETAAVEPLSVAQAVESAREDKQRVDMSLELLDIEALDTGQYHALVVQDPADRRNIKGFCHLAIVYSSRLYPACSDPESPNSFEGYYLPGFLRIPRAMNMYTDIQTDVLGRLNLDDAEILKAPWLCFFGTGRAFELSPEELRCLGSYLMSGGFVFEDCHNYFDVSSERGPAYVSLRNASVNALATQGVEATFQKLPNSHPIYHCYFDFDGPPIAADGADNSNHPSEVHIIPYIEGLEVDGRLVAFLSGKAYAHAWTFWGPGNPVNYGGWVTWDPKRAFQLAVNTIIFALTQEGSITTRVTDALAY